MQGGGGFRLVAPVLGDGQPSSEPIIPRDPNLSSPHPPRGGDVWGLGSCSTSPCAKAPDHSGGSSAASSTGTNPPPRSPRTEFLPIPADDTYLPAPLCARPRGDGAGSVAASTLCPVPSPAVHSGVIRSVCRYLIVLSSSSLLLLRLKS